MNIVPIVRMEEPKDPETCKIFALYRLVASVDATANMRKNYVAGGYGYGHAKKELLATLLEEFKKERSEYDRLMKDLPTLDEQLRKKKKKATVVARGVLDRVRKKLGY